MLQFLGNSKFQRASKSHYWFKSYGNFAGWVNFAHWWSFIGKGLRLQPAQQACFSLNYMYHMFSNLFDSQDLTSHLILSKVV